MCLKYPLIARAKRSPPPLDPPARRISPTPSPTKKPPIKRDEKKSKLGTFKKDDISKKSESAPVPTTVFKRLFVPHTKI